MIKGQLNNNSDIQQCQDNNATTQPTAVVAGNKIIQKFTIKDIVFLAIMGAVLICTCAVMALVAELTKVVFAIGQLATGMQLGLFVTVGLIKTRKVFSLTFMMIFMGVVMLMMSPIMFLSNVIVAIVVELLIIVIFRGYRNNIACVVAGGLLGPLSIITPHVYNAITAPEVVAVTTANIWVVVGMTVAVIVVSVAGALLGYKIGKELERAGALKNNGKV